MFTGIVEEIGKVTGLTTGEESIRMTILAPHILKDVSLGDSISVNGVCLTVNALGSDYFTVDLMPETVRATSLRQCHEGSSVNLERAMLATDRFGGHMVSGHVDGVAEIVSIRQVDNAVYFDLNIDASLSHYMVYKGSVTIDGTSLTIFGLEENKLTLSLIPAYNDSHNFRRKKRRRFSKY